VCYCGIVIRVFMIMTHGEMNIKKKVLHCLKPELRFAEMFPYYDVCFILVSTCVLFIVLNDIDLTLYYLSKDTNVYPLQDLDKNYKMRRTLFDRAFRLFLLPFIPACRIMQVFGPRSRQGPNVGLRSISIWLFRLLCMCLYVCLQVRTCVYVCMYVCMYVCIAYTYACRPLCVCVYVCTHAR
jgi:hypothetical protein